MKRLACLAACLLIAGCATKGQTGRRAPDNGTILIHRSSAENFAYTVDLAPMRAEIEKIPVGEGVRFLIVGEK